jgi:phenylacetate-CoA ligase
MKPREFKKVKEILKFVWENPYSDFYRQKYKKAGINPVREVKKPQDFFRLPFLTKPELASTPSLKLLFTPLENVDWILYSSGTTGKPLLSFRSKNSGAEYELERAFGKFLKKAKAILILRQAKNIDRDYNLFQRKLKKFCVIGDVDNFDLTARVAAQCRIDTIVATVSHVIALAPYLKRYYNLRNIRFMRTVGERINILQQGALKRYYPNARIMRIYGVSEIEVAAFQCPLLARTLSSQYHRLPANYLEVVDADGKSLPPGQKGELVSTHLETRALPLIRYRSGELASFALLQKCPCGAGQTLEISGRAQFDSVQLGASKLFRRDIEEALVPWTKYLTGAISITASKKRGKECLTFSLGVEKSVTPKIENEIIEHINHIISIHNFKKNIGELKCYFYHQTQPNTNKIKEVVDLR